MSDPYFSDVLSLIHFDIDVTTDVVAADWSVNGTVDYSTVAPRYGAGDAIPDGVNGTQISNPLNVDYNAPWTFEGSFIFDDFTDQNGIFLCGSGTDTNRLTLATQTTTGQIKLVCTDGSSLFDTTSTAGLSTGVYYDIAVTSDGTNVYVFLDGSRLAEMDATGIAGFTAGSTVFRWGATRLGSANKSMSGRYDEARVTQVDRYGGLDYTPGPFPDEGITAPPTIVLQPEDAFIPDGGDAFFLCIADSTAGGLYQQWYQAPSTLLLGEKTPELALFNVPFSENGNQYYCVATDNGGSIQSNTVTLDVTGPPIQITSQPASVDVTEGSTATFSVVVINVIGTALYQWKSDGVNVGTDSSVYTTAPTVAGDDGSIITVDVSDDATIVTSNDAILTVTVPVPYPPGFPCPSWQYGQLTTAFQRRTPFDNGWTRQRRQFPLTGTAIDFSFKISTEEFATFTDWINLNGFDWFDIPLDRFGGTKEIKTVRFISAIQFNYRNFDIIYCTIRGEFKDE